MKRILRFLIAALVWALAAQCAQQQMQRQVRESRTVVLDIGHYYAPGRGGQGARTPDASQGGALEECEFWYKYAGDVKNVIERAGYKCIVINRGDTPTDPALAKEAKRIGVIQVKTPQPAAVYLSRHHPKRMAVGILSADRAPQQRFGFLAHLQQRRILLQSGGRYSRHNDGRYHEPSHL